MMLTFNSFILPDFPHTTRWLSEEEKAIATFRLRDGNGNDDAERGSLLSGVRMAVTDYKVWLLAYVPASHSPSKQPLIPKQWHRHHQNQCCGCYLLHPHSRQDLRLQQD